MAVMMNEKGTEMSKTVNISLTAKQIDLLRGVLWEYYENNPDPTFSYYDSEEKELHSQVEEILAYAEDEFYQSN
jgi:hypothetical protein